MTITQIIEMKAVIDWFIKHSVRSISPQTSVFLLEVASEVRKEIAKDPETPQAIKAYATALDMVAKAGHIQQGVVITQLEMLITNREKNEK